MDRVKAATGLQQSEQLIENHRAWTARAFCMATAELRGSFEPEQPLRRESRRATALLQLDIKEDLVVSDPGGQQTSTPAARHRAPIPRY